jgi:photosystem II PsbY protein
MDWRLIIVFLPLMLAIGWVTYNIGAAALKQGQDFIGK